MVAKNTAQEGVMTSQQYRAALKKLDISQQGAARLFKLGFRTSRRYALNEAKVPESIAILLRLMLAGKISAADIEKVGR